MYQAEFSSVISAVLWCIASVSLLVDLHIIAYYFAVTYRYASLSPSGFRMIVRQIYVSMKRFFKKDFFIFKTNAITHYTIFNNSVALCFIHKANLILGSRYFHFSCIVKWICGTYLILSFCKDQYFFINIFISIFY